jgi:hypothetical protein
MTKVCSDYPFLGLLLRIQLFPVRMMDLGPVDITMSWLPFSPKIPLLILLSVRDDIAERPQT